MIALKDQLVSLGADVKASLGQLHSVHSWLLDEYDCNRPMSVHDNGTPMCCGKKGGETMCPPPNGSLPEPLGPPPPPPPPLLPCAAGDAFCMATVRSCSQGGSVRCGDVDLDASLDFAHYGMVKGKPLDAEVKGGAARTIGPVAVVDAAGTPVDGGAKCYANNPTTFSTAHGSPTRRVTKRRARYLHRAGAGVPGQPHSAAVAGRRGVCGAFLRGSVQQRRHIQRIEREDAAELQPAAAGRRDDQLRDHAEREQCGRRADRGVAARQGQQHPAAGNHRRQGADGARRGDAASAAAAAAAPDAAAGDGGLQRGRRGLRLLRLLLSGQTRVWKNGTGG